MAMKHPNEEELIAYHGGEALRRDAVSQHLADCPECRAELGRIDGMLAALIAMPIPEPAEDYGSQVWQRIAPRLPQKRAPWWSLAVNTGRWRSGWLEPRRLAVVGTLAAVVMVAFLAGRATKRLESPANMADSGRVRERILVMAVGEHLGRSEMVLVELGNAEPAGALGAPVNISSERRRAEDLLEENRLYRQTALEQGDTGLATVLDELERVLLDVAHSPGEVTPAQLQTIQKRIAAKGILFKVRVVGEDLQQREQGAGSAPKRNASTNGERNKI
jgi:anti-sigma factor RsiW